MTSHILVPINLCSFTYIPNTYMLKATYMLDICTHSTSWIYIYVTYNITEVFPDFRSDSSFYCCNIVSYDPK